jgi:hypothetical protein
MSTPRTDQDAPWKIILRNYFQEAIEFFFPDTARLIDWSRSIEFLDKELVQIAIEMLPKALNDEVWAELKAYEEENKVPYITSVEKIGFERGIAQGVQQGVQQGEQKLTILLLEQRLGQISPELKEQIDGLSLPQLEALAIALFDITSIAELETWLSQK